MSEGDARAVPGAEGARSSRIRRTILKGVSTNVLVLGVVSMLTDMSSEMIYPVLPLFLTAIGATGLIIGLIEGAAETTASFLKVVSGWYSDRFNKRKPFIIGGYGSSSAVKPLLVFAMHPWQVFGIRIAERVGKGIRSAPRDALIADSTAREVRGKAFGFHKSMDSTGAVLGPIAALIILAAASTLDELEAYRLVFAFATIPAFAAIVVILAFVREKEGAPVDSGRTFYGDMSHLGNRFWLLITISAIFFFGEISYAFFVLKGQEVGLSNPTIIGLYILYNLVFVLAAIPSGSFSDRMGRRPILMLSFLVFALTCVIMAAADTIALLALGFVMFGLYKGTSAGVFKAYVVDVVPRDLRGTALGAFHTAVGLVMLPGGIVAGLLWDAQGPWATFSFGAITAVAAMSLLALFRSGEESGKT